MPSVSEINCCPGVIGIIKIRRCSSYYLFVACKTDSELYYGRYALSSESAVKVLPKPSQIPLPSLITVIALS